MLVSVLWTGPQARANNTTFHLIHYGKFALFITFSPTAFRSQCRLRGNINEFDSQRQDSFMVSLSKHYSVPTLVACILISSIVGGSLLSACDISGSNSEDRPDKLVPLEVGNQWQARISTDFGEQSQGIFEVIGATSIKVSSDGKPDTLRVQNQAEGGILIRGYQFRGNLPGENPVIRLKYPAEDGDAYQHTDGEGSTFRVDVSEESVSVPAGDYDCLLYEIREDPGGRPDWEVWMKPGIGPIKIRTEESTGELISTNVSS